MPEWFEKFIMKGNWFTHYNSLSTPFSTAVISVFFSIFLSAVYLQNWKGPSEQAVAASCIPLNSILPQVRKKNNQVPKNIIVK